MTDDPTWLKRARSWGPKVVAGMFAVSGTVHMVRPGVFTPMIPGWLPAATGLVYASGVAELACAAGLIRRDPWAGPASAAVLLAVFPGNIQVAIDVWGDQDATAGMRTAVLVRLPLQLPMIWAVLQGGPDTEAVSPR
jgi:uncharacterized membrane protein